MRIGIEREDDGRWIADVPDLPGTMAYGATRADAISRVETLALRVIADRLEHGEAVPELEDLFAVPVPGSGPASDERGVRPTPSQRARPSIKIKDLPRILRTASSLTPKEADSFLQDIEEARASLPKEVLKDPWAS